MLGILFVSVSVGLSNFAASIGIGLSGVGNRLRIRIGLAFGFFETLMPVAGLLAGKAIAGPLAGAGHYIGAGLLIATGVYVFRQGRRGEELVETVAARLGFRQLIVTAFALSLDNLVVGFALSLYKVPILLAAVVIGAVSVSMSLIGLELGHRLGRRLEQWSEELSGGVLVLVGLSLASGLLK
ncbi:MAG: manganese efflux pump MntP [Chloroflexota bacterium]